MKLIQLISVLILVTPLAHAQLDYEDNSAPKLEQSIERDPAAARMEEMEVRRLVREKSYVGGHDEGTLEVQSQLVNPQPDKTIKQLQAEYFDE